MGSARAGNRRSNPKFPEGYERLEQIIKEYLDLLRIKNERG
jgi:hypothetical protein